MNTESPWSRVEPAITDINGDWFLTSTEPGACAQAQDAASLSGWRPAVVPGTVAQSLGADVDTVARYDAQDWWFRCHFSASPAADAPQFLIFEGLATLAEVWLNGEPLLSSRNMFVPQRAEVSGRLRADNELLICLRSLDHELALRKPRPRWKTALVAVQNLRWLRTTLLGRMPGWTPPIQPVGIWRPVRLETVGLGELQSCDLQAQAEGQSGVVSLRATVALRSVAQLTAARLWVAEQAYDLACGQDGPASLAGHLTLPNVPLWWPHTHGTPTLVPYRLEAQVNGQWTVLREGRLGFKQLQLDRRDGRVQFVLNGVPVFCRGACWTSDDILALHGSAASLRRTLSLARDAGLNMLRVGGTMSYESDAFYALCDELGILVWQEFMFANMDYPVGDADFRAEIEREAAHHLGRFQQHVSIAAYCGSSEVEQQAAMMGVPAGEWSNDFFSEALPALCKRWHAGIPYFPSSPCEGALPFHVSTGIAHYYGVGAYRRPLADVQTAQVKFATECLGFANVPEPATMDLLLDGALPPAHHPKWKQRQPRDNGAGWDFEDIRDHYLAMLFGLDAVTLRSQDTARYYALSRVVSGEVMRRVFAFWRSPGSGCGGGLVWFLKDLWPGAGWGVIDSTGVPKAAFWDLKRAWASCAVLITDHGLDGLRLQVLNERSQGLQARLELSLFQSGRVQVAAAQQAVELPPRGALTVSADALLGRFADTAYAYRFGPPPHDVVVARLVADDGAVLAEDFHFPLGLNLPQQLPTQWQVQAQRLENHDVLLTLSCDTFLQSVHFECSGYQPDDAYFHIAPHSSRQVRFRPTDAAPRKFKVHVVALNVHETVTARVD